MASVGETCGDCCSPFGDGARLMETKSVTLQNVTLTDLYPFQNLGCGGCSDLLPHCENQYWYFKEKHTTCDSVTVKGPEAGDPSTDMGCDKTETTDSAPPSSIDYYSCTCEGVQTECDEECGDGDRRKSDKLSEVDNVEVTVTGGEDCNCVGIGEDGCEGGIPEGWLASQTEILTKESCEFSAPYYKGGCDPEDVGNLDCYGFAKTKVTYSDGVDIRDPANSSILSDFSGESYPNEWHEACPSWGQGMGNDYEKTVTATGVKTYNPASGECPSFLSKSFTLDPKYKIRWRLQIPSSCYIKIWVAKWEYTSVPASDPADQPTLTLTKDTLDVSVVSVPNSDGFCFNNETECSAKSLWNAVSKEFELDTTTIIAYPGQDPTQQTGNLQKTTTAGVAIVGISYAENWNPPLFKYDSAVWECRVQSQESSCPYSYDYIAQTCWRISDEQVATLQAQFDETKNIVTCDAP